MHTLMDANNIRSQSMRNKGQKSDLNHNRLQRQIFALLALSLAGDVQAADPAPAVLTFSVTTVAATCNMALLNGATSGNVNVGRLSSGNFTAAGSTPAQNGGSFALRLTNCNGIPGSMQPQLSVWGDRADVTATQYLFRASDSTSRNVGIALWYGVNTTSLPGPRGIAKRVVAKASSGNATLLEIPEWQGCGKNLEGNTIAFWAGLSNEGLNAMPTTGSVNATLHFRFFYQ